MTTRTTIHREAHFLETSNGKRFAVVTRPVGRPKGGWLYLHPFAEEMNKSRRMAALCGAALAERGWLVLQIDLTGCGDSAGDFGDAHWQSWLDDVSLGWSWLRRECEGALGLWALRGGCLLIGDWLAQSGERPPLLLWQPVRSGQQHLVQFLRLKAASEMFAASSKKGGGGAALRAELDAGRSVEVAGYRLSSDLARPLVAATLRLPLQYRAPVAMQEVTKNELAGPSPALASLADEWRADAVPVALEVVPGPSFWQTQEIETAPELITASVRAVERIAP